MANVSNFSGRLTVPLASIVGVTATQVPFGSSTGRLTSSSSLTFDDTSKVLTAGGSINGAVTISAANSNTGNGSAVLQAQVGGASSNDPKIWLNIPSATLWNLGVDNSDSDKLKFSADPGGDVGTSALLTLTTAGALSLAGAIDCVSSFTAADNTNGYVQAIANNTNTGGGHAAFEARVGGAGSGDPIVWFNINGVRLWTAGVDNSDSDKFKFSMSGGDPGANTALTIDTAGIVSLNQAAGYLDLSGISAGNKNLKITATSDTPATTWTAGVPANNPAGYMEIDVGGAARYFPFWT